MSVQDSANTESKPNVSAAPFSNCLVEPDSATAAGIRHRRQRAFGISAFLEVGIVAAILIWPLFATGTKLARREFIPVPPYGPHHATTRPPGSTRPNSSPSGTTRVCVVCFHAPISPVTPPIFGEQPVPGQQSPAPDFGVGGSTSEGVGLIDVISGATGHTPPQPEAPQPPRPAAPIRRSEGVQSALLIHRVDPRYPALARQSRREGTVQLHAMIARDGTIESLEVLSGDPLFIRDALEAVRQWRYRPTLLGGEPMEVETFITVNFRLSQ